MMPRGVVRLERGGVRLRTERLALTLGERCAADTVARRLWPGLVPIPHNRRPGSHR